ncbi:MAG: cytochrome c oxidase subunit 3 [Actinobacteria bacterium]|nr:cytochrome c oxidase subunit 3 [Actinomycetota bacterium]MDA2994812.1 cytochrome c oxidase subunit 3 [Actinomycetota bacterium]
MTLALPSGPAPAPRRQLLVGSALAGLAGTTLIGGMLAVWLLERQHVVDVGERFPMKYIIPEVATNVMLITIFGLCFFAQWAVYSARRQDRGHTGLALSVVAILALSFINAQAFVYSQMEVELAEGAYGALFYAVTGTMMALVIIGLIFTVVAAFRTLGGRDWQSEIVSAHALYWYFAAAAYSAVWFVVYVTK